MLNDAKPKKSLRKELIEAASYIVDQIHNDLDYIRLCARSNSELDQGTFETIEYLPRKHAKRYDIRFLRKFEICVQHVAWKIVAPQTLTLACTAEELAFRAIGMAVRNNRDLDADHKRRKRKSDDDVDSFFEEAVWDGDVDLLFDPSMDGIEESQPPGHDLANLAFKDWFKPFRENNPVHPLLEVY